jgi:hypothetical protein
VLQAQIAYFTYMATAALVAAERSAIAEAQANLNAATQRNRVGLATIADVLQARTALSQEQLNLETTQGSLQAARGSLASALGLPANLPFDLEPLSGSIPVRGLAQSVDSVINEALRNRPDLAAARAQAVAKSSRQLRSSNSSFRSSGKGPAATNLAPGFFFDGTAISNQVEHHRLSPRSRSARKSSSTGRPTIAQTTGVTRISRD